MEGVARMPAVQSSDAEAGRSGLRRIVVGCMMLAAASGAAPRAARATAVTAPTVVRTDPTSPAPPRAVLPFRIVAVGSSSTLGIGATSSAATYPADLQRLFERAFHGGPSVSVVNRGVGGEDIDDMVKRLGTDVLARKPDLVIWQVGSNDPLRGVPLDRFEAELRNGIATIRASGAEVVLIEPQWCPVIAKVDASGRFVSAVRKVGAERHVDVVRRFELMHRSMADGLATARELIGPDGLHMTDRGYAMLAQAVFDEISARSDAFRGDMARAAPPHP